MRRRLSRRRFLSSAVPGAALGAAALRAPTLGRPGPPSSERLRLAWIGCGGRGRQLAAIFDRFDDVDIAAICDVNAPRMDTLLGRLASASRRQRPEKVVELPAV